MALGLGVIHTTEEQELWLLDACPDGALPTPTDPKCYYMPAQRAFMLRAKGLVSFSMVRIPCGDSHLVRRRWYLTTLGKQCRAMLKGSK